MSYTFLVFGGNNSALFRDALLRRSWWKVRVGAVPVPVPPSSGAARGDFCLRRLSAPTRLCPRPAPERRPR